MRVILMHGKDTDPGQKWYPWIRAEVEKMGFTFIAPILPKASDPVLEEWLAELDKTLPDEDTILVGHSRGGVAIMRWLERQPAGKRVKKVILVAANPGRVTDKVIPDESNYGFYTKDGYDFEKITSHCNDFVVLHSRDDQWVPFAAGEQNAHALDARFLAFEDRGHFGKGVDEMPELLEEIIHFDARKALLVPMNDRGQMYIQDRRGYKEPDWGYFGGEIEAAETPLQALIRESREELALELKPSDVQYLGVFTTRWDHRRLIRYVYLHRTNQEEYTVHEGRGGRWCTVEEAGERLDPQDKLDEIISAIHRVQS